MKKLLLLYVTLLVALVVWIASAALRDEPDAAAVSAEPKVGAEVATAPVAAATSATATPAAPVAGGDERRPASGSLRVRALAMAKDGSSAPLVDLVVLCFPGEGSHEAVDGPVHRLRTDERGEAVFGSLWPGTVAVRAPSVRVPTQHVVVATAAEARVELRVDDADAVRGIVVDGNGTPVAGADLWLVRDTRSDEFGVVESLELSSRRAGRSASDGTFVVVATDPRERRIAASHAEHGESMARYVQGGRHELRLVLQPALTTLRVRVLDQRERPVVDAAVVVRVGDDAARRARDGTLVAGRRTRTARTDADGNCSFANLPAGQANVTAEAEALGRVGDRLDLRPEAPNELVVHLTESVLIHGYVRRHGGLPQDTVVRILPSRSASGHFAECMVRPDGSYRLVGMAHRPFVVAVALGTRTLVDRAFDEPPAGRLRCDFVVDAAAATTGTVRSADGRPLDLWRVRLTTREGSTVQTLTNARGEFAMTTRFDGPAEGQVFAPGTDVPALVRAGVQPGEHLDLTVSAAAMPSGRVLGRVTDAAGAPVAAALRLRCRSPRVQYDTQCAADGSFAFDGLVAHSWTLEHLHHGTATPLQDGIALGDGEARDLGAIALPATGRLAVDVVDEFGRPWTGSAVGFSLHDERDGAVAVDHVTIDGRLAVEAAPGHYQLGVLATDLLCERVPVTIEAGRTGHARLSVRVGRTLRLRFPSDAADGRSEARALRVHIRDAAGALHEHTLAKAELLVGDRALWELARTLAFGPHRIEAATGDGLRFALDLDVVESFDTPPIVEVPVAR